MMSDGHFKHAAKIPWHMFKQGRDPICVLQGGGHGGGPHGAGAHGGAYSIGAHAGGPPACPWETIAVKGRTRRHTSDTSTP